VIAPRSTSGSRRERIFYSVFSVPLFICMSHADVERGACTEFCVGVLINPSCADWHAWHAMKIANVLYLRIKKRITSGRQAILSSPTGNDLAVCAAGCRRRRGEREPRLISERGKLRLRSNHLVCSSAFAEQLLWGEIIRPKSRIDVSIVFG
jgi:hypothetical protein